MTMQSPPKYQIHAIRFATRAGKRSGMFLGGDPHDGPMDMDYYVWVITGPRTVVVDLGFTEEEARARGRTFLRCPIDALAALSVQPEQVEDVIATHLHYDHIGNFHRFPKARFHLQEMEMHYATGRYMRHKKLAQGYNVEDVVGMVRLNFQGRVHFCLGDHELFPGISLHYAGGHTQGLQCVRVFTERGWVVLASDVLHYYENMESGRPFVTAFNVGAMLEGFDLLRHLADSEDHIVPGHDPLVMSRYPAPSEETQGWMARLDVPPMIKSRT